MKGKNSPWGKIQHAQQIIPGMWIVSTAGHGGIKLDRALNAQVPRDARRTGGWYEEDCEWSIAVVSLKHLLNAGWVDQAQQTLARWYPDFVSVL